MQRKAIAVLALLSLTLTAYPQKKEQKPIEDKPIRISTQLVQWDIVVTDKDGQVVQGLGRDDFELYEEGKKQVVSFFEFVDSIKGKRQEDPKSSDARPAQKGEDVEKDLSEADVKRIMAFVVDDLTIRIEDLVNVREMLTRFVNEQMSDNDLVSIVRAVGGKGLTQQLTSNKQVLHRAIASLTVTTHPLSATNPPASADMSGRETRAVGTPTPLSDTGAETEDIESNMLDNNIRDLTSPVDDTVKMTRALMTLGTASFIIESLKQLPGRKSLVIVSGGMPILSNDVSTSGIDISLLINRLTDRATRAGVAVHTMDVRGLIADVARFTDTPGKSALPTDLATLRGDTRLPSLRGPNEKLFGANTVEDQLGLRALASGTGGIAVLNKNDFTSGLGKIVAASQGYYILAYAPANADFDGKFRKVEVKLKRGGGYRVYARKGYVAKDDAPAGSTPSKRDQLLAIIRSPLAQRDVNVRAALTYKALPPKEGAIDINLLIDPRTLSFEHADGKHQTSFDVAGFVFDEMGEMRGGFNETINANLSPEEFTRVSRGGLTYSANTTLPAGAYQIRVAVRDNKTGNAGTLARYMEVPDLTKGRFAASSLLLFAAHPGDTKSSETQAIGADRQISPKRDLRYMLAIYNAKLKGGKPLVRAQMSISQDGKTLYTDPDETVQQSGDQFIKMGQLGLSRVKPGRYTITLTITDPLADKKWQTLTRTVDFVVID